MFHRRRHRHREEAELDITSFMNLMIILVPVLLMSMVFARITVLDLQLPKSASSEASETDEPNKQIELIIRDDYFQVNFPAGAPVERVPHQDGEPDLPALSELLQQVKQMLKNQGIDKNDIVILSEPDTPYQTLVSAMDTARSFRAVVAASVVNAELFPVISLGDAPAQEASE
ncbi:biopolymer transport protein ExbD [Marinimicrobium koreense]|uniref:Biopolymer transport protein ExbD n=1 Tax=Marinimicrobium koreense TaxID=306545 RepID=A0A3N1P248_9GAMM|nr:biopolymer transporter ExbD [Marinimicrobium koreense]ROQ21601.1 biopolymer transport protein ExbD [Marinimicrobium koreense]